MNAKAKLLEIMSKNPANSKITSMLGDDYVMKEMLKGSALGAGVGLVASAPLLAVSYFGKKAMKEMEEKKRKNRKGAK